MSNIDLILSNLIQHHIRQLYSIHFQWPEFSPCTRTNADAKSEYALFQSVGQNVIKVFVCFEHFTQIKCCILLYCFFFSLLRHRLKIESLWTPHIPSDKQLGSLMELLLGTLSPILTTDSKCSRTSSRVKRSFILFSYFTSPEIHVLQYMRLQSLNTNGLSGVSSHVNRKEEA
jgi:hypothetical protein